MDFDPRLKETELLGRPDARPGADVEAERTLLEDADVFAFVYPLWFNAPPAIVKGYVDRVFGLGLGYRVFREGGQEPLLRGRRNCRVAGPRHTVGHVSRSCRKTLVGWRRGERQERNNVSTWLARVAEQTL
jgi:putative NADPH-quinone reductase